MAMSSHDLPFLLGTFSIVGPAAKLRKNYSGSGQFSLDRKTLLGHPKRTRVELISYDRLGSVFSR